MRPGEPGHGKPYVTIVLPCYNEGEHVLKEIDRITTAMNASEFSYEVLCIDVKLVADVLLDLPGGPEKIGPREGVGLGERLGILHSDLDLQVP